MASKRGPKPKISPTSETSLSVESDEISIALHLKQKAFTDSKAIWRGFVSGIGAGKSFIGSYDLLRRSEPGALYCVVAPTYTMLRDATFRSFTDVATKLGLWNENAYRKSDNQAILNNGAEVLFRSGDEPGKLRGPNLRGAWLDECSQMTEEVYNVMIGRLRYGGQQGWLSGTFTPNGKEHWTFRIFGDKTNPNVELFTCSTKDNPFLDPAFYQNLLLQYGKGSGGILRAQQELEGQFVCVEGAEWPPEWFGPNLWFHDWPNECECIKVAMLDSSKGVGGKKGDYSCFAKVMYAHGLLWVEFDLDNKRNAAGMVSRALEIQQDFRPYWFGVESEFGGDVLADDLHNQAEARQLLMPLALVPTAGFNKEVRIRRITPYLAKKMLRFRDNEHTRLGVAQMESFPHAQHDDAPDALEGAIRLINESGMLAA